jgi:hypothetical protein
MNGLGGRVQTVKEDPVAYDEPRKPAIVRPSEEPAEPLVEHRIWVQVAPPTESDPGAVIEGSFTLTEGGVVRVYDVDHKLLGTEYLAPGADAGAAARRVLREKKTPQRVLRRTTARPRPPLTSNSRVIAALGRHERGEIHCFSLMAS